LNGDMTVEKWTPERRRQLTREALIASAREVFARRGFHAASLEEIAEAAGFTRGAIHSNFENKEDLFFAVLDRHVEMQLAGFQDFFDDVGGPSGATDADVARAWRRLVGGDDPGWTALSLEFRLYALRNPDVRDRFVARFHEYRDAIVTYLAEVLADFEPKPTIPLADLIGVVDWGTTGILELAQIDPTQDHLLETFLQVLDHGAFATERVASGRAAPR
jgi:AcrR family transcriptional regulator